jgi:adenylate cyclase
MGHEIERKFLVQGTDWKTGSGKHYRQGYLSTVKERVVRIRTVDDRAYLTIKGVNVGARRPEYEYEIPVDEAAEMLDELCERPLIEKTRYKVEYGELTWEIDEFSGENEGLVVAEVELEHEDQPLDRPVWIGEDKTVGLQTNGSRPSPFARSKTL